MSGLMRAAIAVALSTALMIGLALATGSTFGQRCHRAYSTNPLEAERCVDRLANGGKI